MLMVSFKGFLSLLIQLRFVLKAMLFIFEG